MLTIQSYLLFFIILSNIYIVKCGNGEVSNVVTNKYLNYVGFYAIGETHYRYGFGIIIHNNLLLTDFVANNEELMEITKMPLKYRYVICAASDGFQKCGKEEAVKILHVAHIEYWPKILSIFKSEQHKYAEHVVKDVFNFIGRLPYNQLSVLVGEHPLSFNDDAGIIPLPHESISASFTNCIMQSLATSKSVNYENLIIEEVPVEIVQGEYCPKISSYAADFCVLDPSVDIVGGEPVICGGILYGIAVAFMGINTSQGFSYPIHGIYENRQWISDQIKMYGTKIESEKAKDSANANKNSQYEFFIYLFMLYNVLYVSMQISFII